MSSAQAPRVNDAAQQQEQEYEEVDSFQARARGRLPLIPPPRFSALSTLVLGEDWARAMQQISLFLFSLQVHLNT